MCYHKGKVKECITAFMGSDLDGRQRGQGRLFGESGMLTVEEWRKEMEKISYLKGLWFWESGAPVSSLRDANDCCWTYLYPLSHFFLTEKTELNRTYKISPLIGDSCKPLLPYWEAAMAPFGPFLELSSSQPTFSVFPETVSESLPGRLKRARFRRFFRLSYLS